MSTTMTNAYAHRGVCCLQLGILERRCSLRPCSSSIRPLVVRHRMQQRRATRIVVRAESSGDDAQNTQLVSLSGFGSQKQEKIQSHFSMLFWRICMKIITIGGVVRLNLLGASLAMHAKSSREYTCHVMALRISGIVLQPLQCRTGTKEAPHLPGRNGELLP